MNVSRVEFIMFFGGDTSVLLSRNNQVPNDEWNRMKLVNDPTMDMYVTWKNYIRERSAAVREAEVFKDLDSGT